MRFRLLRRRLTISAPRVAIRSALPWPLRWLALAVVLGFCAAVALWTFEWGQSIAGLGRVSHDEVLQLQASRQLSPEQLGCAAHAFKRANDGEGFDVQWEVWDNLRAAVGRPIPS